MSQTSNIKLKALSGVIWKMAERMGSQLVSIVVGVILARILTPEDYSVVAIVSIFFVFCNVFITGGLNTALIQKKDADELDYSTVLFVSLPISILLYLVMFFTAPVIANLYNKQILVPVIRVMSLTLIITAYQGVVSAKISNDLAFKKTFLSSFVSIIISAFIGIVMAYKGFGAWALVAQQMSASIIGSVTLTIVSKIRFKLAFSVERLKGLFNYGWKMFVASVISVIYDEIKPLIVGLKFSAVDLAYYNKGKGYPQLLNSSICDTVTSVLFPVISKFQENKNDVLNITRRFMSISSYIVFPMLIGFYVLSDSFITVVLTEKWLPISPYIKIFCVSFIFNIVQTANLQAIRAIGRSDVILKLEIIKKTLYFIVIALFIYFSDSPYMLAVSGIVCTLIATIVNTYPNRKLIGYKYRYQFIDLLPNLVIAIIMGAVVYFVNFIRIELVVKLVLQIFVGVFVYIALSIVTKNENYKYLINLLEERVSKKIRNSIRGNLEQILYKSTRYILGIRKLIIFKPHPCFSGNVHALYEYLVENGYDKKYKFIWCTSFDGEKVPEGAIWLDEKTVKGKYYYKACAKYIFYENECPTNKIMRGQKVIYLSHGSPALKNSKGYADVFESKTTDALITSNEVRGVLAKIRRFPEDKMFVCGHPKNDIMFNEPLKYLDFLNREYSKYILWMPTFRKTKPFSHWELRNDNESISYLYGLPLVHNESDLEILNESLKSKNILLIIKPHPSALKEGIEKIKYSNISVWTQEYLDENEINIHRLFKDTSAFISDYSSVIFDAMLADKPLAYVIDDIDDYKLGFAYDNVLDYMPGHHIKTLEDMILFFEDVSQEKDIYKDERHRVNTWANTYADGNNCKRIVEIFGL